METIVNSLDAADIEHWWKAWQGVGAVGDGEAVLAELVGRYSEPHRAYHNLDHIRDCLAQLALGAGLMERTAEVEIAIWFHDAIYDPRRTDNEEQSAQWMEQVLAAAGVPDETIIRIVNMIRLTDHQEAVGEEAISNDAAVLCDADLAILGAEPERFDHYDRQIREEYAWVPELVYKKKRGEVLAGFLRRPRIYRTRPFFERYEAQARQNLERVLSSS